MTQPEGNLKDLEAHAAKLMRDLDELTKRVRGAATEGGADSAAAALGEQLAGMKEHLKSLDQSLKKNPWLFVLGATLLGFLLGKATRR